MARRILSRASRLIPNFAMAKPADAPMSPEESEGLALSAILSGAGPDNNSITALLGDSLQYVYSLGKQ